jgi:hypothetical protein
MENVEYYYAISEDQKGPFTIEELLKEPLQKNTRVWKTGMEDWKDASEFDELKEKLLKTPPPLKAPKKTEETQKPKDKPIMVQPLQKKPNRLWKFIKVVLIVFGCIFIIGIIFLNNADSETKKRLFQDMGIENSKMVEDLAMETFVEVTGIELHTNIGNKCVIKGWIRNTHQTKTISSITFRVRFQNGNEEVSINKILNPNGLGKPFKIKIAGHSKEMFEGIEVIKAD